MLKYEDTYPANGALDSLEELATMSKIIITCLRLGDQGEVQFYDLANRKLDEQQRMLARMKQAKLSAKGVV